MLANSLVRDQVDNYIAVICIQGSPKTSSVSVMREGNLFAQFAGETYE